MNRPTTKRLLEAALNQAITITELSYSEAHALRARLYSARQRARQRKEHQFDSLAFKINQAASSWELHIGLPKPLKLKATFGEETP